jgi:hypothetical protein
MGRKAALFISVVGLVLVIVGILWATVIFPSLDKMPADYSKTYYFDGSFTVLNPQTQKQETFPVKQELYREAVETFDGYIKIHEVRTVTHALSGTVLPEYGEDTVITIDRRTLEFIPALDEQGRTGYSGPPRPCTKDTTFDLWNSGARRPLTARYSFSDEVQGLGVLVFEISESNLSLGKHPQTGADLYYSTVIRLWIEPLTGTVVKQTSSTTTSMSMMGTKIPVNVSKIGYSEATIDEMVSLGKSARTQMMWFKDILPWLLIGIGVVLVLVAVAMISKRQQPKSA